ncbi:MAG: aldo/keto reductase [Gaiellaceae bacterium]
MKFRQLGDSDLHVSEICLGSWLTYGGGVDDAKAEACVDAAFDDGINFVDTANAYAGGKAEEFLGRVLERRPRNSSCASRTSRARSSVHPARSRCTTTPPRRGSRSTTQRCARSKTLSPPDA